MNKEEFIKLFNLLKEYHNMENDIYEASHGTIDLGTMPEITDLTHYCISSMMCNKNEKLIECIYELMMDDSTGIPNGPVVDNVEEFYNIVFGGEKE